MEAAESGSALSAPPRAGSAQERPCETKRFFGHREIPQPEEHGPDLRGGHGAPTRAEEIQDVLAVVVSRSSTVRAKRGNCFSLFCLSFYLASMELMMGVVCMADAPKCFVSGLVRTLGTFTTVFFLLGVCSTFLFDSAF